MKSNCLVAKVNCFILFTLVVISCKKREASEAGGIGLRDYGQGFGQCRLVETRDTSTDFGFPTIGYLPQNYSYDDFLRLSYVTMTESGGYRFYYDYKNLYRRIGHWTGITPDSIALDDKGNIIKNYREIGRGQGTDYFYSPLGEMQLSVHYEVIPIRHPEDSTFYYFENGDLIKHYNKSDTTYFTYYLNEPFQIIGDGRTIDDLQNYGRVLVKTRHLVKSITDKEGEVMEYTYEFDDAHKITKLTATSSLGSLKPRKYERYYYYRCD